MSSPVDFHSQIASIIEVLANAAVSKICKVVDDGYAVVHLEVTQNQKDNEFLRRKVRLLELQVAKYRAERMIGPEGTVRFPGARILGRPHREALAGPFPQGRLRGLGRCQKTPPLPRDQDPHQQVVTSTKMEAAEAEPLRIVKVEGAEPSESDHTSNRPDAGSGPTPLAGPEEPRSQSEVSGSDALSLLFTSGCSQEPLTGSDVRAGSQLFPVEQKEGRQRQTWSDTTAAFTQTLSSCDDRTVAAVMVVDDDEAEDYLWSGGLQKEHERGREEQGWREERRREEEQGWRGESFTAGLGFIAPGLSLSESLPASSAHKLHYRPPLTPDPGRLAPHGCGICRKRFGQEAELQKHAACHRRRRAHECSLCGKSFVSRSKLDVHGYVHTGERPFSCTVCPRRFSHPSNLRRHQKLMHNH
ncbi:zinc finger protein 549 [Gadus morhua]|uniref:zinc finger protein 549 n=1 Tax=Gadus morhua TaxID=8049 RepID=UPI0011B43EEE|nr:zinc finger protein 549-like [Gadus morhua]